MKHTKKNESGYSRRHFIKLMAGSAAFSLIPGISRSAESQSDKKVLVVYFSHTGNTKEISSQIREIVKGDLFEIIPSLPYPSEIAEIRDRARKEYEAEAPIELKTHLTNLNDYDTIFIGTPVWMGTYSVPVYSFVKKYNLAGKTVVPFVTYNSNAGNSLEEMNKLFPSSTVLTGISIKGSEINNSKNELTNWINGLF